MTIKVLTGTYASGYALHPPVTILTLAAGGYVGGTGIATSPNVTRAFTVANLGTIDGSATGSSAAGVFLGDGGKVTNGSASATSTTISAYRGVRMENGVGAVTNFGTIVGTDRSGIILDEGGSVTNGSASDRSALISNSNNYSLGIYCGDFDQLGQSMGSGTVTNFGTVTGGTGIELTAGGDVTNGSASDTTALVRGSDSGMVLVSDTGADMVTVANFGTISANGTSAYGYTSGVTMEFLGTGSKLTNGSGADAAAFISGQIGVEIYDSVGSVINFGTIEGTSGVAIYFTQAADALFLEGGSTLLGGVDASGGTIHAVGGVATIKGDLVNVGAITGAGSLMVAGAVSVFGPISTLALAQVTLTGEGYVGGKLTVSGKGSLSAQRLVVDANDFVLVTGVGSVLTVKGSVSNAGAIEVAGGVVFLAGSLTNTGSLQIRSGTLQVAGPSIGNVAFTGTTGILELGMSILTQFETITFAGSVTGLSTTGKSSLDLLEVPYSSGVTQTTYVDNGHKTGGVLTVTSDFAGQGQSDVITLVGDYVGGTFNVSDDGHFGTKVTFTAADTAAPPHAFIAAMASLGAPAGHAVRAVAPFAAREPMLASPRTAIA